MQRRAGDKGAGKDACVGSVVRISSPTVHYDASAGGTAEGGAVYLGWEYCAMHTGADYASRQVRGGGMLSALSCMPAAKEAKSRGVLASAIVDDASDKLRRRGKETSGASGDGASSKADVPTEPRDSLSIFGCASRRREAPQPRALNRPRDEKDASPAAGGGLVRGDAAAGEGMKEDKAAATAVAEQEKAAAGGVGLVLTSWRPRGLTQALNVVSGTHARVALPSSPQPHIVEAFTPFYSFSCLDSNFLPFLSLTPRPRACTHPFRLQPRTPQLCPLRARCTLTPQHPTRSRWTRWCPKARLTLPNRGSRRGTC